mgnify:CR=1 FL=1
MSKYECVNDDRISKRVMSVKDIVRLIIKTYLKKLKRNIRNVWYILIQMIYLMHFI